MARKVLLIDDDRLQFRLTQANFTQFRSEIFELDWASTYSDGLSKLVQGDYAACLLDYQLGPRDGLQLLREAVAAGCRVPIVFLTAETDENVDIEAMNAGALDYLIKGEISVRALERSLRYALKLGETLEALRKLATRDELTGLLNRREFGRILGEEHERSRRFQRPCAVLMLDLDHFKRVNDTYGHPAGDQVLRAAAQRIGKELRSVDRFGRVGGEEFAIMLAEVDGAAALAVVTRLVDMMASTPVKLADGTCLTVTMSAGAAAFPEHAMELPQLFAAADKALYAAKGQGRNCAVLAELGDRNY